MDQHIIREEKKDRGFTLIELLIVIVILGILATVTVFAVRGITDTGKKSSCKADYKTLETAVEAYSAQWGAYPAAETNLVPGLMRTVSGPYNVDAAGNITADGSATLNPAGCTSPPTN